MAGKAGGGGASPKDRPRADTLGTWLFCAVRACDSRAPLPTIGLGG